MLPCGRQKESNARSKVDGKLRMAWCRSVSLLPFAMRIIKGIAQRAQTMNDDLETRTLFTGAYLLDHPVEYAEQLLEISLIPKADEGHAHMTRISIVW